MFECLNGGLGGEGEEGRVRVDRSSSRVDS